MESMRQIDAMLPLAEVRDLADEVRRLFDDLDRARTLDRRLLPGVFSPTLDAQETPGAIEIVVDLPGVALDDIRILIKGCVVIIAGGKMPPSRIVRWYADDVGLVRTEIRSLRADGTRWRLIDELVSAKTGK